MIGSQRQRNVIDYANEIWKIANFVRDVIPRADYNKVILPFALIRRIECILESSRNAVYKAAEEHKEDWGDESDNYCQISGRNFYNITDLTLGNLKEKQTDVEFRRYINGFSKNVREILQNFEMDHICKKLHKHKMLYPLCQAFASISFDPCNISDRDMSDIYEHLILYYGNDISENAEDYMTPKDVVRLCTGMLFAGDKELLESDSKVTRTIYDQTCGTCGFLTDALDYIDELQENNKIKASVDIIPYGEELADVTWAMGKAALLLRNSQKEEENQKKTEDLSENIKQGNTLTDDKFAGIKFDYCVSNPPYGKSWRKEEETVRKEATLGFAGRYGAGVPAVTDGSMLFMQNMIAHMKTAEEGGSKGGIVLSGSSLYNGDKSVGTSGVRTWMLKNDLIECIVKLPANIFCRTGITTYLWIINTKKDDIHKGKVQLIDAYKMGTDREKSLGNKYRDISEDTAKWIIKTYMEGTEGERSKMVPNEKFYTRTIMLRIPLAKSITFDSSRMNEIFECGGFRKANTKKRQLIKTLVSTYDGMTVSQEWLRGKLAEMTQLIPQWKSGTLLQKRLTEIFGKDSKRKEDIVYNIMGNIVWKSEQHIIKTIPYDQDLDEYIEKEIRPNYPLAVYDDYHKNSDSIKDGKTGAIRSEILFDKFFFSTEETNDLEKLLGEIRQLESEISELMKEVVS